MFEILPCVAILTILISIAIAMNYYKKQKSRNTLENFDKENREILNNSSTKLCVFFRDIQGTSDIQVGLLRDFVASYSTSPKFDASELFSELARETIELLDMRGNRIVNTRLLEEPLDAFNIFYYTGKFNSELREKFKTLKDSFSYSDNEVFYKYQADFNIFLGRYISDIESELKTLTAQVSDSNVNGYMHTRDPELYRTYCFLIDNLRNLITLNSTHFVFRKESLLADILYYACAVNFIMESLYNYNINVCKKTHA